MTTTTAALSAGTEVEHRPGCICEDRAAEDNPAIMWDERAVIHGVGVGILADLEARLRVVGEPALTYRRARWNDQGKQIGPELAIRSCEVEMVWKAQRAAIKALDRMVAATVEAAK